VRDKETGLPIMQRCRLFVLTLVAVVCAGTFTTASFAQTQSPLAQGEEVIKVNTSLVQTDVMVFTKEGSFVDGLKREQFVLKIDGKPREISFFEQVRAGSRSEETQLAAARGQSSTAGSTAPVPLDRGRTIFFFLDDLHLSPESMNQARRLLTRFIDRDMGQNDQAGIASSTGQIGFLQQLTDNKAVLRAAIERLKAQNKNVRDFERPVMSEYQALLIDRFDREVLGFFVDAFLRDNPGISRQTAEDTVKGRASQMLHFSASVNKTTMTTLASMVHTSGQLPGRKVVFFISDGFFLDSRNSDTIEQLRRIATAAAASGVVIYSIDARGLIASLTDASSEATFDPTGRAQRSPGEEISAAQDGLNGLARDTGGRAFFNTNDLSSAVTKALKESSVYYLLAWRPETDQQRSPRFRRIEVSILQRPEVTVRFRSGWIGGESRQPEARSPAQTPAVKNPPDELRAALRAVYPKTDLPVSLNLNFLNLPDQGSVISSSVEIPAAAMVFDTAGATPTADALLAGLVFDEQGKVVNSFEQRVGLRGSSQTTKVPTQGSIYYNHHSPLKPGLYQVRVAGYDLKAGKTGSATQWIEVPDLTSKTLTLSSLIVGEKESNAELNQNPPAVESRSDEPNPFQGVRLDVDRRFARSSSLRFLIFVYNARQTAAGTEKSETTPAKAVSLAPGSQALNQGDTGPDLAVQVHIFRDNEPVLTTPLRKIQLEGIADLTRLPYAAELAMKDFGSGSYVLQVTVIDRRAKASAVQRFRFQVD
jgi:VWFA-related protein